MKFNLAVITGGDSSEYEVSLKSSKKILRSIDTKKFNPYEISIVGDNWTVLNYDEEIKVNKDDFSFLLNGEKIKINVAFLILHGAPAENGKLQAYFDMIKLPYVGCNNLTSAITFNKFVCNNFVKNFDVKVANSIVLYKGEEFDQTEILTKLSLPVFVKPNEAGSSFGVSKVNTSEELLPAIEKAFSEDNSIMIEEFIEGLEVTNGIFKLKGETHVLPITEVIPKNEFFDYEAKYNAEKAEEITPARISNELTNRIKVSTKRLYNILKCEGIVRIDYIIKNDEIYFLEVNTIPGMTDTSFIPQQIEADGLQFDQVINSMIEELVG
jgi:D-alanine-D-alanine ligase